MIIMIFDKIINTDHILAGVQRTTFVDDMRIMSSVELSEMGHAEVQRLFDEGLLIERHGMYELKNPEPKYRKDTHIYIKEKDDPLIFEDKTIEEVYRAIYKAVDRQTLKTTSEVAVFHDK